MHLVIVSYPYEPAVFTPTALLERYTALVGWAEAVAAAGAQVTVIQRFHTAATLERGGVHYQFVHDRAAPMPRFWQIPQLAHRAAAAARPDVAHLQGQIFPLQTRALRRTLPRETRLLVQHHAGDPPVPSGLRGRLRCALARWGLVAADGFLFTSEELAAPWRTAGIISPCQPVYPVIEASTSMGLTDGGSPAPLRGRPVILWVGRLHPVKDPLTVLNGFALALAELPNAVLTMIYGSEELLGVVRERIARPDLAGRVDLVGRVEHEALPGYFAAADLFVLGSRREAAGFALIEALACGVAPAVTDIPAFRAVTGGVVGALWSPGDARACAQAIVMVAEGERASQRVAARARFEDALSWERLGRAALTAYMTNMNRPCVSP